MSSKQNFIFLMFYLCFTLKLWIFTLIIQQGRTFIVFNLSSYINTVNLCDKCYSFNYYFTLYSKNYYFIQQEFKLLCINQSMFVILSSLPVFIIWKELSRESVQNKNKQTQFQNNHLYQLQQVCQIYVTLKTCHKQSFFPCVVKNVLFSPKPEFLDTNMNHY